MLEKQRQRVERAVTDMIDEIYKSNFKKMQFDMHLCCARCCEDQRSTMENVQNCIENCAIPLVKAQDYLQHELGQFQGQLQHCIMRCSDDTHNKMPQNPNESDRLKSQYQFERCTIQCVDKHIGMLPAMMKSIKTVLARGPQAARPA